MEGQGVTDTDPRIFRRSEVFVVGGQPTITYNPRPSQGLTERFHDYLEERGRILCVTGPTKSGKTVLVREVVPHAIRVSGGEISSIDDFWADVVDGLAAYTAETAERTAAETTGTANTYSGAAKVVGSGVEGGHTSSTESGTTTRYTQSREREPRRVAKQELIRAKPPVVLDDFHHIEPAVQRQIVRGVKDLVFEGVPVIFVAVPHRAADVVRAEREMQRRVEQLAIMPWAPEELGEIASTGFDALNVECEAEVARRFAAESYGSPHLMQDFCLQICKASEITETLTERVTLIATGMDDFFRTLAEAEGTDETYRRLAQGPRQRTDPSSESSATAAPPISTERFSTRSPRRVREPNSTGRTSVRR